MSSTQRSNCPTQRSDAPADGDDPLDTIGFDLAVTAWGHAAHAHTFGQLVHAIAGRASFDIYDCDSTIVQTHTIDTASAIWIPPMVWHSARFEPGFSPSAQRLDLAPHESQVRTIVVDDVVRAELLATQWSPDEQLTSTRAALAAPESSASAPPPHPTGGVARAVADYLDREPGDTRDLDSWARDLHTSTATIRRAFKAETGLTYSQWRIQHRLHAALGMLRTGSSLTRVAAAVGYSDAGFAAAVRRHFGCAPSELDRGW